MRIRTVKPEFWTDEKTGQMSIEAALVFLALLNFADDAGRLRGDLRVIRGVLFPYRPELDIDKAIKECISLGMLQAYVARNQSYLWIVNFNKHQKINRPTPSLLPAPTFEFTEDSLSVHGALTEDSLNTHGALTEDSLNTHGALTEGSLREGKGKEGKGNIYSVADATSGIDSKEKAPVEARSEESLKTTLKAFQSVYNEKVGDTLPQWSKDSQKRNAAVKTWLKSRTLEDWSNLLEMVKSRPFLMGQNDRGWKADALWLLKTENAIKVEEGKYSSNLPNSKQSAIAKPQRLPTYEEIKHLYEPDPEYLKKKKEMGPDWY